MNPTRDSPYQNDRRSPKTFTLPVSGSVLLYGPEIDIVASREFQRLAGLKQLGTSYVVFRGAIHTRFEHSVGALHEAERMVAAINSNPYRGVEVDAAGRRLARLGALLHDLPHVPFGHTLEDELHLLQRHDVNEIRFNNLLVHSSIGEVLRQAINAPEYDLLLKVLKAKEEADFISLGQYAYVADIIGNTLCADLLDYVKRDLTACGMPVAVGDRYLDYLTITDDTEGGAKDHFRTALNIVKRGMPRPDVESEIIKVLEYRYELAERVYFHHSKNAASVMIGRAVHEGGLATGENSDVLDRNFHWLSDELLLHSLANPGIHDALDLKRSQATQHPERSQPLARGVLERDLFKIAYLAVDDDLAYSAETLFDRYSEPGDRLALEDQLASESGLSPGDVLIHVPRPRMMTKEADIRVRTNRGEIVPLKEWDMRHSRRVHALNEAHRRLWRVTVYIHPEHATSQGAVVRAAAESVLKAESRYVDPPKYSPLMSALFDQVARADGLVAIDKEEVLAGLQAMDVGAARGDLEASIRARIQTVTDQQAAAAGEGQADAAPAD